MVEIPSPRSINPANIGDLSGTIRFVLKKFLQGTDDMLPAKVIAYDRVKNRAQVQPLIAMVNMDNERVTRAQIASIPVLQLGGGGFVLSFPIQTGDIGWIKANDADISSFLQTLKESTPNTQRMHSFSDAVFIPDTMMRQVVIDPSDSQATVLQSLDGSVKISLGEDTIKIQATDVQIVSDTLTHNGTNIGDTHVHGGVQTGGSNTGVPV